MFKEIYNNRYIIYRMAMVDTKAAFKATVLSYFWIFVNPILMIGVYLFSFYAAGDSIETIQLPVYQVNECVSYTDHYEIYSKIGWLIIGVLTWSYIGNVITCGSKATRDYWWMIGKIGSPLCVPPLIMTLSKSFVGFITIIASWFIYMITAGISHDPIISYSFLTFPIVLLLMFLFLSLWSLTFAPVVAISKDFYNFVVVLPSVLQWLTGVFLPLTKANMNQPIGIIFRINPFNFLVDNVRGSIMGNSYFWNDWVSMTSFFSFFALFLILALILNKRAKRIVVDLV